MGGGFKMISPEESATIGEVFFRAAQSYGERPFLAAPANRSRAYHQDGYEIDFAVAAAEVRRLMGVYEAAGYGHGHRIALFLENRPEYFLHKLALNSLGACCVPVNPDYRTSELVYLLIHSRVDLAVVVQARMADMGTALGFMPQGLPLAVFEDFDRGIPRAARSAEAEAITSDTPASILYTSGTTGRPKGCVLSHYYELASGAWYATRGFLSEFRDGGDRLYNPLPLYHVNAGIYSFYCMLLTGNCQVQTDRFHPDRWWPEIRQTRATVVHYLGVIAPLLLGRPPAGEDREHHVRFGLGAGVEPTLHQKFEDRFGFPLIEVWGMTEFVGGLFDNVPSRKVGTRSFGRIRTEGFELRVVDDDGADVPAGTPGEMLVRHSAAMPRKRFFSGYFDDPEATRKSWAGGWFHTGDVVLREADGTMHFVDRRKNIIRRSGENIAAAEVEAVLQLHPFVRQVSVVAVQDELREEEVLACVVLAHAPKDPATARVLFDFCNAKLAYYKAPGWVWFADKLPTTGTQKIQKHEIFPAGTDPRRMDGIVDLRPFKKRTTDARPPA
jgi:acyl-CoA synthetase (AMP-forming)/AMP-acid ligase II